MRLSGFEKLSNTRDLGGLHTQDGKVIKYNKLLRSGRLYFASENDIDKLKNEYYLKRIIDFRNENEIARTPDPIIEGVQHITCSILKNHVQTITKEKSISEIDFDYMKHVIELMDFNVEQATIHEYPQLIEDEYSIKQYKKFFEYLLEEVDGSTLYHCSAGKDRVGVGTLLLLGSLGVSKTDIIEDYLKTNYYLSTRLEYYTKKALELHLDTKYLDQFPALCCVKESYIQSIFDVIDAKYGSIEHYLIQCLGLSFQDIKQLKSIYLE